MESKAKSGQSKSSLAARKAQNKGVKDGTIRRGAAGKADRKYNAKTGRWEIVRLGDVARSGPKTPPPAKASEGPKRSIKRDMTAGPKTKYVRGVGAGRSMTDVAAAERKARVGMTAKTRKDALDGLLLAASLMVGGGAGVPSDPGLPRGACPPCRARIHRSNTERNSD